MLEYQLIEKNENTAKRNFFNFVCFRSGLKYLEFVERLAESVASTISAVNSNEHTKIL